MTVRRPSGVRIVAGAKRGRRLAVPAKAEVRPTGEMVREAVFDVLGPVGGVYVLDLFAGTGALGLEALSRGARACVFVENDARVATVLRGNIDTLEFGRACRVVMADYAKAVSALERGEERFDLLFVDPPYRMLAEVEATLTSMVPRLLSPEGVMVIEGPRSLSVDFGQSVIFERHYGDTKVSMIRLKE
jgi:16S rRNA (guanine966-N2)-methyltransferase